MNFTIKINFKIKHFKADGGSQSKNSDLLRLFPQLATIANQQSEASPNSLQQQQHQQKQQTNNNNKTNGDGSFLNKSQLFAADLELSELSPANSSFNTSSNQQRPPMPPLLPIPPHLTQPSFLDPGIVRKKTLILVFFF